MSSTINMAFCIDTYRPDLGVGGELEGDAADDEVEVRERGVLRGGDAEQAGGAVELRAGRGDVLLVRVWGRGGQRCPQARRPRAGSPVAIRMRVVPVSTMPAVLDRMVAPLYVMDWLIPQ